MKAILSTKMEAELKLSIMDSYDMIPHCLICNDEIDEFDDSTKQVFYIVHTSYMSL